MPDNEKKLQKLQFWCQKTLPTVFDDSLSYYELLCKVVNALNNVIEAVNGGASVEVDISGALEQMIEDGTLQPILEEAVAAITDPKFTQVEQKITTLTNEVGAVTTDIAVLEDDIAGLNTDIAGLEDDIAGLTKLNLFKKKLLFVGDSWAVGTSTVNPSVANTIKYVTANALGCDYAVAAEGGVGFVQTHNSRTIASVFSTFSKSNRASDFSAVVIIGGVNDLRGSKTSSAVATAIKSLVNSIKTWGSNLPIYLCLNAASSRTLEDYQWYTEIYDTVMNRSSGGAVAVLPDFTWHLYTNIADWYESESDNPGYGGVHPTAAGYIELGNMLASALLGGGAPKCRTMTDVSWLVGTDKGTTAQEMWFYQEPYVHCTSMVGKQTGLTTGIHYFANHNGAISPRTVNGFGFTGITGTYMGVASATTTQLYIDILVQPGPSQFYSLRGFSAFFLGYTPK